MEKTLEQHIASATSSVKEIKDLLNNLDTSGKAARKLVGYLLPRVEDALSHLEKADTSIFESHLDYALSLDTFNPFNLLDVERYYYRSKIDDPVFTAVLLKRMVDVDSGADQASPEERIGNRVSSITSPCSKSDVLQIVVFTISSADSDSLEKSKSIVLHGFNALVEFQDAEERKTTFNPRDKSPIANSPVRNRLLAATRPPRKRACLSGTNCKSSLI